MVDTNLCCIELPFPPTMNTYWRHIAAQGSPRTVISKRGRQYSDLVKNAWYCARPAGWVTIRDPVKVTLTLYPPDRRQRDLDNHFKALFDALTKAGFWADDSLVHELHARWGTTGEHGACVMLRADRIG